jgi:tRNA(Ile)-lysidine synthase
MVYQQVVSQHADNFHINLKELSKLPNYRSYLYQWLHEFDLLLGMMSIIWLTVYQKTNFAFLIGKIETFLILSQMKSIENEVFCPSAAVVNIPLSFLKWMVNGLNLIQLSLLIQTN